MDLCINSIAFWYYVYGVLSHVCVMAIHLSAVSNCWTVYGSNVTSRWVDILCSYYNLNLEQDSYDILRLLITKTSMHKHIVLGLCRSDLWLPAFSQVSLSLCNFILSWDIAYKQVPPIYIAEHSGVPGSYIFPKDTALCSKQVDLI